MFIHYSIILIVIKTKNLKVDQENYNHLFNCIENNLRELGFGDVSVNKKMKDLNKILYDILLKLNLNKSGFKLNKELIGKYFNNFTSNDEKWDKCKDYFEGFYKFCFDMDPENMLKDLNKYKF